MSMVFQGIRVIDVTHVLAGPFATYQLGLLGADVIKIEEPGNPDQSRGVGTDPTLNRNGMGTQFLTQASNKRSLTLDLKSEAGRDIFRRLIATADVMVENYRPDAIETLGLGYEAMAEINPRLVYCSISAFGRDGPRRRQTAYDPVIQATSGLMAMTGTPEVNPIKLGAPVIDYATGAMAAFALASALFQRERTGHGQRVEVAMLDVAMLLMGAHLTDYMRTGRELKPRGNIHPNATNSCYPTKDGLLMLGANNIRQQKRFWTAVGRPDLIKETHEARAADRDREAGVIEEILGTRTAEEWEVFFQSKRVPAARVRSMAEAVADPQIATRGVLHHFASGPGIEGRFGVPAGGMIMGDQRPTATRPPPGMGEHTDAILAELGYHPDILDSLRSQNVI